MVYKIIQWDKRNKRPCAGEVDGDPISDTLFIHSAHSRYGGGYVVSDIETGAAVATEATRIEVIARAMELVNSGRYARAKKAFLAQYGPVESLPLAPTE